MKVQSLRCVHMPGLHRRRQPFAGDIRHQEGDLAVRQWEKVIKVAPDLHLLERRMVITRLG